MTHRPQFGGDELQEKAEDVHTETAHTNTALYGRWDVIQHGNEGILGVLRFSESLETHLRLHLLPLSFYTKTIKVYYRYIKTCRHT